MFTDAVEAFREVLTPPFRAILLRSVAITIGLLIVLGIGLEALLTWALDLPYPWLNVTASILGGVGILIALAFMVGPVTSLLAGFFADDAAEIVERTRFPQDPPGVALPLGRSLVVTVRFALVTLVGNIVALALLLVPGVNIAAFFLVNGYLLGREYFEAAAMRFRSVEEARAFRRRHGVAVFVAGLVVAVVLAIPFVNLVTPLFATAFMVRLHKRLSAAAA